MLKDLSEQVGRAFWGQWLLGASSTYPLVVTSSTNAPSRLSPSTLPLHPPWGEKPSSRTLKHSLQPLIRNPIFCQPGLPALLCNIVMLISREVAHVDGIITKRISNYMLSILQW